MIEFVCHFLQLQLSNNSNNTVLKEAFIDCDFVCLRHFKDNITHGINGGRLPSRRDSKEAH